MVDVVEYRLSMICELARMVLDPRWLHPSVAHGAVYTPAAAVEAGFLNEVCPPATIAGRVREKTLELGSLPDPAYAVTKARWAPPSRSRRRTLRYRTSWAVPCS